MKHDKSKPSKKPSAATTPKVVGEDDEGAVWAALKAKKAEKSQPPAPKKKEPPPPDPETLSMNEDLLEARTPMGWFTLHTATGSRVSLVDILDPESTDFLVFSYDLRATLHVKRRDLFPTNLVNTAVKFFQTIR